MRKTCIIAMLLFSCFLARGQCIISSCGGEFSQGGSSISVSVGEVFTDQLSASEIQLSTGVTAPASISETTSILSMNSDKIQVSYDLSSSYALIKTEELSSGGFYEVYSIGGEMIRKKEIKETEVIVSLREQGAGIYLLKINTGKEIKIVKLIKK